MVTRPAAAKKLKAFLLATGDEFLRRSHIECVLNRLLPSEVRPTNLFRVYPDDFNWSSLCAQAKTMPLVGDHQVFWVSGVDRIKHDWSSLEPYCEQPAPGTLFVFEGDTLLRSHLLIKLAVRFGEHVHFSQEAAQAGFALLKDKVKRAGKQLTPGAWQALSDRLGGMPRLIDLCLDQLILYAEGGVIDEQAVRDLSTKWFRYEPFDLGEALAQQNVSEAIQIFRYFYDLSGDLTSAIGLIHWQLRRIWQAKKILAQGGRSEEIGRELRVPPFKLQSFLSQARRFDLATIERLLGQLWEIDWRIKTGGCEGLVAMETFLASVPSVR